MKKPHILLATSNTRQMLENIRHIIDISAVRAIENEIEKNTKELFALGEEHYNFAKHTPKSHWRQRISRFYYGAYNVRRAIQLYDNGLYRGLSIICEKSDAKTFALAVPIKPSSNNKAQTLNLPLKFAVPNKAYFY